MKNEEQKVICFDCDGTLANCEWRQTFLRTKPRNWMAFKEGAPHDPPHLDIIWLLKTLAAAGNRIFIVTARTEDERQVTLDWLNKYGVIPGRDFEYMYMRAEKDYRDDSIIKKEILDQMTEAGHRPDMVVDDRARVVAEWRKNGIRCLQCAEGNF